MKKVIVGMVSALVMLVGLAACGPNGLCGSEVPCGSSCMPAGSVCCDASGDYCPANYLCAIATGKCVPDVSGGCGSGYQACHGGCVPFPSDCCASGGSCFEQRCSSNNTCQPVLSTDCGDGRWCPEGHACLNGGTQCSP